MQKRLINLFFIILFCNSLFAQDIIVLKDSTIIRGDVVNLKGWRVDIWEYGNTKIQKEAASNIVSIKFYDPATRVAREYFELQKKLVQATEDPCKCLKGELDAKKFHKKEIPHLLLGFLGPWSLLATTMYNPKPEDGKNTYKLSKNSDLFDDPEYRKCYAKKATGRFLLMETITFIPTTIIVVNEMTKTFTSILSPSIGP